MGTYIQVYSPETYETFGKSSRDTTGFSEFAGSSAPRLRAGDRLFCYMTVFKRWVGILEAHGPVHSETTAPFDGADRFSLHLDVRCILWLDRDRTLPIEEVWDHLSFTRGLGASDSQWTGKVRRSPTELDAADAAVLDRRLHAQEFETAATFPIDDAEFQRAKRKRVRRGSGDITVSIPSEGDTSPSQSTSSDKETTSDETGYTAHQVQGWLAHIGRVTGHKIWIPPNDRSRVADYWEEHDSLVEKLPLSYDDATIQTVEQIDVLWIKQRMIARAFEVEHTTVVYSGLLRMADMLALIGRLPASLHIVAPFERRDFVMRQITRPVFSLLDEMPLAEKCSFLSYDDVKSIHEMEHLDTLRPEIVDKLAETADL